ncbi:tannase and feruloyl esterase [Apiospora arundinis]
MVDVNETIVIKYVNPQVDLFRAGLTNGSRQSVGYWTYEPTLHCVEGMLTLCGGGGDFLSGTPITACGYTISTDADRNVPGKPLYGGGVDIC